MVNAPKVRGSVVVGVDSSTDSLCAVDLAAAEAARAQATLLVLYAQGHAEAGAGGPILAGARARARGVDGHLQVRTANVTGPPVPALLKASAAADLLVVGARGRGALASALLGSTSLAVASRAQCPVIVVQDPSLPGPEGPVVVGVDAGTGSEVLACAFEEASQRGSTLVAVHAWSGHEPVGDRIVRAPSAARQERIACEETVLIDELAGWPEKYADVEVRRYVARGHPAAVLEGQAHAAQLLVIGRGGDHDGDTGLGPTASALLHSHACPLLIVPRPTEL